MCVWAPLPPFSSANTNTSRSITTHGFVEVAAKGGNGFAVLLQLHLEVSAQLVFGVAVRNSLRQRKRGTRQACMYACMRCVRVCARVRVCLGVCTAVGKISLLEGKDSGFG